MVRRARVDPELCVGSGTCEAMNHAAFELTSDGIGSVRDDFHDFDEFRSIAECCPAGAIEIFDDSDRDSRSSPRPAPSEKES